MRYALLLLLVACDDEPTPADAGPAPAFPADYRSHYEELRDCRPSHEHELNHIRVFASPSANEPYRRLSPDFPYPVGALLVKEEYELEGCRPEDFKGYTVMVKEAPGYAPEAGDWRWQQVTANREVVEEGTIGRCIYCHRFHCAPPLGYDLSCAEEL